MVVIGVLAGPSVVSCFNSEGNMGQCLRGKLSEAGILPSQSTALATPEQTAPAEPAAATPAPAPETTAAAPQPEATPPAAEVPGDLIGATFGLLRAEPDGSVVIAGSGTPGSEVQVFSNGDLLGQTKVEPSGDWVLVPDAPIPPGGTEITLGEAGKPGQAAEAFVVVINPDKSTEPLVVASTPGAASQVLQGLTPPPAGQSTDVAAATPAPTPAQPEAQPAAPTAQPAAEPAPAQPAAAPEATTPPATPQPTAEPTPAAEPTTTAQQPAAPAPEAPVANTETAVAGAETAVAAATPAPTTPPAASEPAAIAPPTIDAIEIEGDRTFFAGGGPEGATMRLYVDDTFIADTIVSDGRWLVEAGNVLTKPSQRIRVDMLQPGSAQVASRAEVDFVVDLPKAEPPVAVAQADQPKPETSTPAPAAETSAPAQPTAAPSEPAQSPTASQSSAPAASTEPSPAQPAAAPTEPEPASASDETSVPTMVATAVGDPEAARFASGKAIIRTGDNLWTIARRVYGAGIKYTTIYEANNGQIRDPDRIYPGQVFDLPSAAN